MAIKHLLFRSVDLGADIKISLSFAPPTATLPVQDDKYPWKTAELSAKGLSDARVTWVHKLGFCAPQFDKNYVEIAEGEGTILMGTPPETAFTPPIPIPGLETRVQVFNQTAAASDIGLGYIIDDAMTPTAVWKDVPKDVLLVAKTYTVLRAFVEVKGADAALPGSPRTAPIWEIDLLSLAPNTMIVVFPDGHGWFFTVTYTIDESEALVLDSSHGKIQMYTAELAFTHAEVAPQAIKSICDHLSSKGYLVNVVHKDGAVEASISMTVLHDGTCAQAAMDLLAVLESGVLGVEAPHVTAHHGSTMVSGPGDATFAHWRPIAPCDSEWWSQ
ncbi:hypothetical protein OH77DRAFT_692125 [Trametes cingulata]|nr:hypothetical protein OH77DRAFT_692125 [Trametes cingulata]